MFHSVRGFISFILFEFSFSLYQAKILYIFSDTERFEVFILIMHIYDLICLICKYMILLALED